MIKAILFDFDGTLYDSSEGIYKTANATMDALNLPLCNDEVQLKKFVGPPLKECFKIVYGIEDLNILKECVDIYRKLYTKEGMFLLRIYPGIKELLIELKTKGYLLGVCTLKYEKLCIDILENQGMLKYFDIVKGTDESGKISKSDCINNALRALNIDSTEALMVGDTMSDLNGSLKSNVEFAAVSWGFGFDESSNITYGKLINNINDLNNYIKEKNND